MAVVLETTIGDMTIDLFTESRPVSCRNFLKLCKMKYYNFSLFHTLQRDFIVQTGDPTGTGKGGESVFSFIDGPDAKYILGEKLPKMKHDRPGLVSMVNCGNHLIGSQFFITLGADLDSLDEHIVFGEITEGHEILFKLNEAICDLENRPYKDIRISHTVVLEDPFDDMDGLIFPAESPAPTAQVLASNRIAADEEIEDPSQFSRAELEEMKADQEAKAQATILEIVGDIPDVECAPPENVLFVCKLNPVTTDEDLQIIFSRFGKINSSEVIRDKDSGDSLQYAFIEFDNEKSCEDAYLKMDNVLIDDRRIHVDFSQSVAKLKWRGKGRGVIHVKNESEPSRDSDNKQQSRRRPDSSGYYRDENRKSNSRRRSRDRPRSKSRSRHREPKEDRHRKRSRSPRRRRRRSRSRSSHDSRSYRKHEYDRDRDRKERNSRYRDRDHRKLR